jgi:hypothetical protein
MYVKLKFLTLADSKLSKFCWHNPKKNNNNNNKKALKNKSQTATGFHFTQNKSLFPLGLLPAQTWWALYK